MINVNVVKLVGEISKSGDGKFLLKIARGAQTLVMKVFGPWIAINGREDTSSITACSVAETITFLMDSAISAPTVGKYLAD